MRTDLSETVGVSDETDGKLANEKGDIFSERIKKTDRNTTSEMSSDLTEPAEIKVSRENRVDGFEEEGVVAVGFIKSYNSAHGSNYKIGEKTSEDNDYADRVMISENDSPENLNIQIRHLDDVIIEHLGKNNQFEGQRNSGDVIKAIRDAIESKAKIDPVLKTKTILQLILPTPLGEMIRQDIENDTFDSKGFREVWVSPFHEDSFQI